MWEGGGVHWLVRMEWRPVGWSVCLPLLISPCTIKSRSSLLAPAHLGGPGQRAVKRLYACVCNFLALVKSFVTLYAAYVWFMMLYQCGWLTTGANAMCP